MNLVICIKGQDTIRHFIEDAIRSPGGNPGRWNFIGSKRKIYGSKESAHDYIWTQDTVNPIYDGNGNQIGWDKTVSEITPVAQGTEIAKPTHNEVLDAYGRMKQVADMSFAQLDTYIENNVTDLASAKAFLKVLAKAVLATIKIQAR